MKFDKKIESFFGDLFTAIGLDPAVQFTFTFTITLMAAILGALVPAIIGVVADVRFPIPGVRRRQNENFKKNRMLVSRAVCCLDKIVDSIKDF